ncbi:unnamed protein product [Spirodela intermedia]|uniref:Uncharacterized protein n=1 Tax=Spirodela intermedia TaxID=51605 RepID=A0ABN7EC42_SPIIN|nr:unnamed protein product [Spirodela intermedia]
MAKQRSMKWVVESSPTAVTQQSGKKNGDFAALWRLSLDEEELDGGGARVRSFILRSAQQEEALHRIWYALKEWWRLVSWRLSSSRRRLFCRRSIGDDLLDGFAILFIANRSAILVAMLANRIDEIFADDPAILVA